MLMLCLAYNANVLCLVTDCCAQPFPGCLCAERVVYNNVCFRSRTCYVTPLISVVNHAGYILLPAVTLIHFVA